MHIRVFGLVGIKKTQIEKLRIKWIRGKLLFGPATRTAWPSLLHAMASRAHALTRAMGRPSKATIASARVALHKAPEDIAPFSFSLADECVP
jgi:hypothetical protein